VIAVNILTYLKQLISSYLPKRILYIILSFSQGLNLLYIHLLMIFSPRPLPLRSLWLHLCVWSNSKPATNVRSLSAL